jgi:hypothetical protein
MIDYADLNDDQYILEPSAGIGSILDRIRYHGYQCKIDAVELRPALTEIIKMKGYNTSCEDILDTTQIHGRGWDRILMVAIMSSGSISGTSMKCKDFKAFREKHHAFYIDNGQAFKNAFNSTGVSSVILVIDK